MPVEMDCCLVEIIVLLPALLEVTRLLIEMEELSAELAQQDLG